MTMFHARRGVTVCLTALGILAGTTGAYADDGHGNVHTYETPTFDMETDPLLTEDALITDDAEGALAAHATTCSYETVQTAVNPTPSSGSFQLLYFLPSDATAQSWLDVPRSCSNGSVRYSNLAMASRNMATWLDRQNADLNYRTLNITYNHNYTGSNYSTRGVRRFRSTRTESWWSTASTRDGTRMTAFVNDLYGAGFRTTSTKYMAVMHAATFRYNCTATGACTHVLGQAQQGGAYGFAMRYYAATSPRVYLRYGCATAADNVLAHEGTHMLNVPHVTDHSEDLMYYRTGSRSMKSSPATVWDHNRNSYHSTVRSSGYAGLSGLAGNYYSC